MGSKGLPLQQKGIYHNLPTFSKDIKGLTAIVTGANGISGFHTMVGAMFHVKIAGLRI